MKKTIAAGKVKINGKAPLFQTKYAQAVEMLSKISMTFRDTPLLIITDSWFGNDGLFKPMREVVGQHTHILSRFRVNAAMCAQPSERKENQRGRSRKYGDKIGNAASLASGQ